ncbi:aspartate carbamoyltransferase catalytic subunit [Alkalicoccus luteus]|uniref:Aspartate carbamoyltransferase n=1 Tax=Alkalicoccus luteus TaxID=1237094 RepID=A0A969TSC3_9BACI|nr:aspartate carbamoyltransferase catalytic subunit [Alkalicoccus luteus]NJP36428.1 aspartate carbamoyltransferase catalytic subunit [Alkalicoccus luteus]
MKSLTSLQHLSDQAILSLLDRADKAEFPNLANRMAANVFLEPSTRTKCSFEMAEMNLGMRSITIDEAGSSLQKGETLYDTVKTLEAIGVSAVIIRTKEKAFYNELHDVQIPIINAGDGSGDHPTQSLLDLLTIKQEFGTFRGLQVVISGDIRHSRIASANAAVLERLGATVRFSGPSEWMPEDAKTITADEGCRQADVWMALRTQLERHDESEPVFPHYLEEFGLTPERADTFRPHTILMHPGPVNRGVELHTSLVEAPFSRIFKQMANGVKIRQAVLAEVVKTKEEKCYEKAV